MDLEVSSNTNQNADRLNMKVNNNSILFLTFLFLLFYLTKKILSLFFLIILFYYFCKFVLNKISNHIHTQKI
jgi:hypothetical protein